MQITTRSEKSIVVVEPVGDMGLYNLGELKTLLQNLRNEGKLKIVLDMAKVPGIDSISIGFLIQETTLFHDQFGELKIARLSRSVHKSLSVTETLSQMNIYDDLAEALGSFQPL
ncbi:MAG: STAS domain-containing protein [Spirochaetes bacterium]|nr:STAS domain-containing protein [Spirochaetota bacterium]